MSDKIKFEQNPPNNEREYIPFDYLDKMVNSLFENQYKEYLKNKDDLNYNRSLNQLTKEFSIIQQEEIEQLFPNQIEETDEYNAIISTLRNSFKKRLKEINFLENREAFFIYDSGINLTKTEINIMNFVKYLCSGQSEALLELCFRLMMRFHTTNRNIIRLLKHSGDESIFPSFARLSDVGSLARLRDDIASALFQFFPPEFRIKKAEEYGKNKNQPADTLGEIVNRMPQEEIAEHIIKDRKNLLVAFVNYFTFLHINMDFSVYSMKRWEFVKKVMLDFIKSSYEEKDDKLPDGAWLRKIYAGFLMTNKQYVPKNELILMLSDNTKDIDQEKLQASQRSFLNELAPSTLHKIQRDLSFTISYLQKVQAGEKEEKVINKLFETPHLGSESESFNLVASWLVEMYEKGLITKNKEIEKKVEHIKKTIREEKVEESLVHRTTKKSLSFKAKIPFMQKDSASLVRANSNYSPVFTTQNFFTGDYNGCLRKEFEDSIRVFNDERVMKSFSNVFSQLFSHFAATDKGNFIVCNNLIDFNQEEYYLPFNVKENNYKYIFAIGMTGVKGAEFGNVKIIHSYQPYLLLMGGEIYAGEKNLLRRKIEGETEEYHHMPFNIKTAPLYYRFLYQILHLLPDKSWMSLEAQRCLFYLKELPSTIPSGIPILINRYWRQTRPVKKQDIFS